MAQLVAHLRGMQGVRDSALTTEWAVVTIPNSKVQIERHEAGPHLCEHPNMDHLIDLVAKVDQPASPPHPELDFGLPPRMVAKRPRRSHGLSETITAVAQFHIAFNLPLQTRPHPWAEPALESLRVELLRDEFEGFVEAVRQEDIVGVDDALGDIVYVAYGSALTCGIDLDAVLREVHRANMSKLGPDGRPLMRDDGKVLKPETYSPPDIRRVRDC